MTFPALDTDEAGSFVPTSAIAASEFRALKKHSRLPNPMGNALIRGDNAEVLTRLEAALAGRAACVYIDPPYNNNESYEHYEDRWNHSEWLSGLKSRIELLRSTLAPHGSMWISIDDAEVHHVRVMAEQVFGAENFVTTIVWNHRKSRENRKVFSNNHEYVLCFAKDKSAFKAARNGLPADASILDRYKNPDQDSRGAWQSISANVQAGHATPAQFYTVTAPSGATFEPPKGRCWAYNKIRMDREIAAGNIYFGKSGRSSPRIKKFLTDASTCVTPQTLWSAEEVGTTEQAKKHLLSVLTSQAVFDTPKPEPLIQRVLTIATNPGDFVIDAFLGSGTTAAVAHKMGRAYLGIEEGQHVLTHCAARLSAVVDGEGGGVSQMEGWAGGGGFTTFELL